MDNRIRWWNLVEFVRDPRRWLATEDGSAGNGTGRHIACFVLEPKRDAMEVLREAQEGTK